MAPFSVLTASVSLLAKSFSVFSCTSTLARCTSVLPAAYVNPVKCLTSQASGPPKRPLNGYFRYFMEQKPIMIRQNPEIKTMDIIRKVAQQWRTMSPQQKQPFQEASLRAREQFKVDFQRYQAQLTPAQVQQQALEKRERMAKRKAIRKKREMNSLGKPKRPRTSFNIFMSEHYEEARGTTTQAKMKSLLEDWTNLLSHQKQVYTQLAQDDKIRYKNEIKSWEEHMVEIGREDLLREQTLSIKKRLADPTHAAKKTTKKAKGKKATAKGKSKTTRKTTKSSSAKTVRTNKTTDTK
ncbi:transcription factor A, mitochondrial [Seriola lalandi dorsalis]|uniref:Transcription factor A, mitochondrial n=1 Tax=Seriola lalandi dorsalis TaxID=1841481 RepID=A0A3B4XQ74_SERLL|nr:transcription factor A, mitochondrial [Seriola lalandi dorsalis]XP_056221994.1 transcription factor A, mitochondrial [Seriola aureovittata]